MKLEAGKAYWIYSDGRIIPDSLWERVRMWLCGFRKVNRT